MKKLVAGGLPPPDMVKIDVEGGEIAVLGTVPEARRIGLGRALLRWGVAWLEIHDAPRITLLVDGDNEQALVLYLSEEFHVARTREVWAKPGPGRS